MGNLLETQDLVSYYMQMMLYLILNSKLSFFLQFCAWNHIRSWASGERMHISNERHAHSIQRREEAVPSPILLLLLDHINASRNSVNCQVIFLTISTHRHMFILSIHLKQISSHKSAWIFRLCSRPKFR